MAVKGQKQIMQNILDSVRKKDSVVVDEVLRVSSLGVIQKIMQELLKEQVSIRNTPTILETISDIYPVCKNVSITVENVRQTLGRQIALQYADDQKVLHVMKVDNDIIQNLINGRVDLVTGPVVSISPEEQRNWIYSLQKSFMIFHQNGYMPVLLVQQEARILVKVSTEKEFPSLAVLSYPEIYDLTLIIEIMAASVLTFNWLFLLKGVYQHHMLIFSYIPH